MSRILHVLLTGGVGSRLWPLSRQSRPKQYLNIFSESKSLFEMAVERNAGFVDQIIVVGNQGNRQLSEECLQKLGVSEYIDIVEATPRNTAPAIAFAAFAAKPEDILLVTPADHIIQEGPEYSTAVQKAIDLAGQDSIVTFGIQPSRPETGYGYIEHTGEDVLSFREKPAASTAEDFLSKGNFLWNSGMFCFKAGIFLNELKQFQPEVYENSLTAWGNSNDGRLELETSLKIPSISVDYAVMENSDKIKVVPSSFEWSDMGSFEAIYDYLRQQGHPVDLEGNMVIGTGKFTAFVGMRNSILVCTQDANLVLQKEVSQDVKKIYQQLEEENSLLLN
ncbi:mannose-1-phosphate guanylyltransferase [Salinimicrobium sediminilitoris]|uniref:mannose-1-phosphate guanylyltransferase n=1 Tax=Salinimicrobium sediminilitoris TaxID=2876715 RepID=UPI001E606FA7|nr:sugar phosphate nucleotidyltransferase [Salinimicrobium sediminilitoris]MCC8358470.1 NTP transferase domain-containing protein [Salinimicrobium sediminilitoris]